VQQAFQIEWSSSGGQLRALEPSPEEVAAHAGTLAVAYNDPRNASLLGHTSALFEPDVVEHYEHLHGQGARPFLLFRDGVLAGDADLRGIADGAAEFAFLIAAPDAQGRGLGTRFAVMVHAFAFTQLGLDRIYASVVPVNVASRRVFEKLGYVPDDSAAAVYGDEGDLVLAVDRASFERRHAAAMAEIQIARR